MKKFARIIVVLLIFGLGSLGLYFAYQSQKEQDIKDSSALYGGKDEYGYPSAGFLITYTKDSIKTCGYSVLTNTTAITASHCVDDAVNMYLGKNTFNSSLENKVTVLKATQKEGWINGKNRTEDFAILNFKNQGFYQEFAQVASPVEGCKYKVVAYGRTEDPLEDKIKPRKSAQLCATEIGAETFKVNGGPSAGICFGDSGSPVYYEGTNKVVGVIVSIIHKNANDTNPCAFDNTAIVVRADANKKLIDEKIQASDPTFGGISVTDGLTISVAQETFFEKIGLGALDNLSERDKYLYLFIGVTVATGILIIITIIFLLKSRKANVEHSFAG